MTMFQVGLYILCSSCMLVINKASVMALPYSYTVTALQTGASAFLLLVARALGVVSFQVPSSRAPPPYTHHNMTPVTLF